MSSRCNDYDLGPTHGAGLVDTDPSAIDECAVYERKEWCKRTSGDLPGTAFANDKLRSSHFHLKLSFGNEETHEHFPSVFPGFEAVDRQDHETSPEEICTDDSGVLEIRAMNIFRNDRVPTICDFCER